jgi:DNA-binding MarR family transcriptional regulator
MIPPAKATGFMAVFTRTMVSIVRSDMSDLTARQLAVFLKLYMEPSREHSVSSLALGLRLSKPTVSRALDRLEGLDLTKREFSIRDGRVVIARKTVAGAAFLRTIRRYADADEQPVHGAQARS